MLKPLYPGNLVRTIPRNDGTFEIFRVIGHVLDIVEVRCIVGFSETEFYDRSMIEPFNPDEAQKTITRVIGNLENTILGKELLLNSIDKTRTHGDIISQFLEVNLNELREILKDLKC